MSGPWEKYASPSPADGPWSRYQAQETEQPAAPEMSAGDVAWDAAKAFPKGFNQGLATVASAPYWLIDKAGEFVSGGDFLPNVETLPGWDYMFEGAKPETQAGRYAASTGNAIGASALPTAGLVSQAPRLAAMAPTTTLRAAGQNIGQQIAARPGAAVGAEAASATGAAVGQQMAEDGGAGPVGQTAAAMVGGIAPFAAYAGARQAMRPINRARANMGERGAYGTIVEDLDQSVDDLARSIATGHGAGGPSAANREFALRILGEEMVTANGNVQTAQAAAIQRIAREANVTPETARDHIRSITQMYEDSPLTFAEAPAVTRANDALRGPSGGLKNPENVELEQLKMVENSTPQATLDYLANSGNAPSAVFIRNQLAERHDQLGPMMRRVLERIGPQNAAQGRAATIDDAADIVDQARQLGQQAYRQAYNTPIRPRIAQRGMPALFNQYQARANARAGESRDAIRRALQEFTDPLREDGAPIMDLQRLQDARGALRGMITEYTRAGRDDLVRAVQPIYRDVTNLMERMSPEWAQANRLWADMNFERIAADLGDDIVKRASPRYREQMQEFRDLAPEAQDIVRIHWLQQQYDKLANLGDDHSVAKLFTTDQARRAITDLFGDRAAVEFTRAVRDIKAAEKSTGAMKNSATHRRGVEQARKDADTGLVAAADNMNVQGVRSWLLTKAQQLLTERRNRPLARILSTPMQDTASVAMHLERLRQQREALDRFGTPMQFLFPSGSMAGQAISGARDISEVEN